MELEQDPDDMVRDFEMEFDNCACCEVYRRHSHLRGDTPRHFCAICGKSMCNFCNKHSDVCKTCSEKGNS